jgi:hypothetical protein
MDGNSSATAATLAYPAAQRAGCRLDRRHCLSVHGGFLDATVVNVAVAVTANDPGASDWADLAWAQS